MKKKTSSKQASPPSYWQSAATALAASDPVMDRLVGRYAGLALVSRGDPFETLARAVVGQQISVKAADCIWRRLMGALPQFNPAALLAASADDLRACGLSARKLEYLSDLAGHFADGRLQPDQWFVMSDAAVIDELTAVRGIGVWTAEMFLIFNLLRPDVWPVDDIGLQKAVAQHYFAGSRLSRKDLLALGERWRPWRSVATWYLWRSLDPVPVAY